MSTVLQLMIVLGALWIPAAVPQQPPSERIRRMQALAASTLDPSLPEVPIGLWLQQVLGPSATFQWTAGRCVDPPGPMATEIPLCGIVVAARPDTIVTLGVRLGDYLQETKTDRPGAVQVDAVFVSRGRDLLLLDRLGDLPGLLDRPHARWPSSRVVLESARCDPERPQAYAEVTCVLVVRNDGDGATVARLFAESEHAPNLGGEFVVRLRRGARRTTQMTFGWPSDPGADVTTGIRLEAHTPYHRVSREGAIVLTPGDDLDLSADLFHYLDDDDQLRSLVFAQPIVGNRVQVVDVPVDRSTVLLSVAIESVPGTAAALTRPDGRPVREGDAGVIVSIVHNHDLRRHQSAERRSYTIASPEPGMWHVALTGGGTPAAVQVHGRGRSPIRFAGLEFVRKQEGVHGGYFRIKGQPLFGAPATALAFVPQAPRGATFHIVDEQGRRLNDAALRTAVPGVAEGQFVGSFDLPSGPFRMVMEAVDESGAPIRREYPPELRGQPVAVFLNTGMVDVIRPGMRQAFTVAVTNLGTEASTFSVSVDASMGDVLDLSPRLLTVQPGTSAIASFVLRPPVDADPIGSVEVEVTAASIADASVSNSTSARLEIARPSDADDHRVPSIAGLGGVSPQSGGSGTVVRIAGEGFNRGEVYYVLFDGLPAPASVTTPRNLTVTVPDGVAPGPLQLVIVSQNAFGVCPVPFIVRAAEPRR